jgi:hypothetical protein
MPAAPCELVEHGEDKKGCCISCLLRRHEKLAAGVRQLSEAAAESIAEFERVDSELSGYPDSTVSRQIANAMRCVHQIYHAGLREIL